MGVRENKVEKYLDERVQSVGGITRKWVSPGRDGVPDRIVIIKGRVIFVEVKTTDGVVDLMQNREQQRLIREGAEVHNVYGAKGVNEFIESINL